jgi:glycosyltransferase involved in cell wall biosynthesis
MIFLIFVGLTSLLGVLALAGEAWLGSRQIGRLRDVAPGPREEWPAVSIIVPALNEATTIRPALASLLALDYPALEIIVVNDRSTDATGLILAEMARAHPRLRVHHLRELPAGWLGKNHALWFGATRATGAFLLFTDADVVMAESSLRRAINFMLNERLDHLAVFFEIKVVGGCLNMLIIDFACAFMAALKPWRARRAASRNHIGVGAFNLVRAATYRRCGTHQAIALQPVDDVELGRLLKDGGGRQDCLFGYDAISVKWYGSVAAMVRGLEKNIFPFCNYSLARIVAASALIIVLRIWPMLTPFTGHTTLILINGLLLGLQGALALGVAAGSALPLRHLIWFPLTPFVGLYILWNSTLKTLWRGGIVWRDTFYSLDLLRKRK